ncbi:hypothetical protein M2302_002175 [Micromonospora sp. A200]|nr:hypothetical protein [Micromonospora sp. A200]MDH6462000.1 hypothetical protein [Micromonospora sp. A200]
MPSPKAAEPSRAPCTTWALVSSRPSVPTVIAEPAPAPRAVRTDRAATLGSTRAATPVTTREYASSAASSARSV